MKIHSLFRAALCGGVALISLAAAAQDSSAPLGSSEPADVIIYNAKVLTVNSNFAVAQAIVIRDGRIVAVGKDKLLETYRGPKTRLLDAQGKTIMPGLFDASVNSYKAAASELATPLPALDSIAAAQEYIRREASNKPASGWIMLGQVYPTRLKEGRMPVKADLDAATTNYAVYWNFGPMAVVNSKALAVSRITKETQNPRGGIIEKDPKRLNPTGLLRNASSALKLPQAPAALTRQQERDALKRLYALYNEQGITSIGEAQAGPNEIDLFRDMSRSNELTVRITATRLFQPGTDLDESVDRLDALTNAPAGKQPYGPTGAGDDWVRIGPLKTEIDGDLNVGTAYLRTPYGIGPIFDIAELAYRGEEKQDSFLLGQFYAEAAQRGWQLAGHAAGDAALDFLLNGYEKVQFKQDIHERRFLILDSAFAAAQDWRRCEALGVGVVLEPGSLYEDGSNLMKTLGDNRMTEFVPFKGWFARGITAGAASGHLAGTNSLEAANPWNPWLGIWTTLTRETKQGTTIQPEQQLTREQAIRLYTVNNAWLNFQEKQKGSLEAGKLADLIMLDTDIVKCPVDQIRNTRVLLTMVNGQVVWESRLPVLPGPETVIPMVTVNVTNGAPVTTKTDGPVYPEVDLAPKTGASANVLSNVDVTATNAITGANGTNSTAIVAAAAPVTTATNNLTSTSAPANTETAVIPALAGAEEATNAAPESMAAPANAPTPALATNAATVITVSNETASITVTIQPKTVATADQSPAAPISDVSTNSVMPGAAVPAGPTATTEPTAMAAPMANSTAMEPPAPAPALAPKIIEPAPPTTSPSEAVTSVAVPTVELPATVAPAPAPVPMSTVMAVSPAKNAATNQVADPADWSHLVSQDSK